MNRMDVMQFLKRNKWVFLQMGCIILPATVGYANDGATAKITALQTPLTVLQDTFTGVLPKVGVSIAGAAGAMNYAIGTDNQVTKTAMRVAMGGGLAIYAIPTIGTLTGASVSACLFL